MTDTMIVRVAREIAKADGCDFDRLPIVHGPGHGLRNMFIGMAKAAIEAMQEPTEEMIDVGYRETKFAKFIYQAMIKAALKE